MTRPTDVGRVETPQALRSSIDDAVRSYGRETVAWQGLGAGFSHWVGTHGAASYVDTGGAWVVAGSPLAPPDRLADTALELTLAAEQQGRRACFFAAEQPLVDAGLRAVAIGEQPVWHTPGWPAILAGSSSLRYQLSRARNKGVTTRPFEPRDATAVVELGGRWQASHKMPPMGFLVDLAPLANLASRLVVVAERPHVDDPGAPSGQSRLAGFASAIPVPARDRLFVEHFVRSPDAPNGTVELLIDAVMRAATTPEITLGLAPLAGHVPRWLRLARWLGTPLYDFAGLRAFKAKLHPHAWEPIYLCTTGGSTLVAMRDALRAFAGGTLIGFASRALAR